MKSKVNRCFSVVLILLLGVAVVLGACAPTPTPGPTPGPTADEPVGEPIKVGSIEGYSSPTTAEIAGDNYAVLNLAADKVNAAGGLLGRPVEVVRRDNAGSPEQSTRMAKELYQKEGCEVIFCAGPGSANAMAVSMVAKDVKKLVFVTAPKATTFTCEEYHPYIFRTCTTVYAEAAASATVALELIKGIENPKVEFIGWDYIYPRELEERMQVIMEAAVSGLQWGSYFPAMGELDFSPQLAKIQASKPDLVLSSMWGPGAVSFYKQAAAFELFEPGAALSFNVGGESLHSAVLWAGGEYLPVGSWANGNEIAAWPGNEGQREYHEAVMAVTGKKYVSGYSYYTDISFRCWAKAVDKAGTLDTMEVIKALEGMTIDTFQGEMSIREFDHNFNSLMIFAPVKAIPDPPYREPDTDKLMVIEIKDVLWDYDTWYESSGHVGGQVLD